MGFSRARAKQLQPERFAPLGRARLAFELRSTQQPDSRAQRSSRVRSWTASLPVVSRQLSETLLEQEKREPVEPAPAVSQSDPPARAFALPAQQSSAPWHD